MTTASMPSTTERFFDGKYRAKRDPWDFETSEYEQGRYATILRALKGRRYRRALEPGCSIGVLTERLAGVCDHLEALDFSAGAIQIARKRCADLANVTFTRASVADFVPRGPFDLIALCEIGYYFTAEKLARLARELASRLVRGGTFLAVHWLGVSEEHVLNGNHVHEIVDAVEMLSHRHGEVHTMFRLDRWERL
jgi:SAM-dependent methyltransferase